MKGCVKVKDKCCPPPILVESRGLLNVANEPFTIQPADSNYAMRTKKVSLLNMKCLHQNMWNPVNSLKLYFEHLQ